MPENRLTMARIKQKGLNARVMARALSRSPSWSPRAAWCCWRSRPGQGDIPARRLGCADCRERLLLRPAQPLAAWHLREHERAHPAVPAQRRGAERLQPGRARRHCRWLEHQIARDRVLRFGLKTASLFHGRSGSPSQQVRPTGPRAWRLQMQTQASPKRKQEKASLRFELPSAATCRV